MAKIFATKALSMVLCFVMLFMGAPVTTWAADPPSPSITVKSGENPVIGDDIKLDTAGGTLTLTANGFTGGNATWSLSEYADTWVSFGKDADSKPIVTFSGASATLYLDTLPALDYTTVTVTATGVEDSTQKATVEVSLKGPRILKAEELFAGFAMGSGAVLAAGYTKRGSTYSFIYSVPQSAVFSATDSNVAYVYPDGRFDVASAGSTVVTVTDGTSSARFILCIISGIDHVSIVPPNSTSVEPGDTVPLTAKAYGSQEGGEISDSELDDAPFAWSITSGKDYASVDTTGNVIFNEGSAGQTVTVRVASTFDPSKSDEVTFTVDVATAPGTTPPPTPGPAPNPTPDPTPTPDPAPDSPPADTPDASAYLETTVTVKANNSASVCTTRTRCCRLMLS